MPFILEFFKKMKKIALIMVLANILSIGFAQKRDYVYPEVGLPCPNFKLSDIQYYYKQNAELKDFKGKWLVLDFWNKSCTACIAAFPREDSLQRKYSDKVQVMLVAMEGEAVDKEKTSRRLYAKFRKLESLSMPCAFDSTLWKQFDIWTCPHTIVIDQNGIVRAITNYLRTADMETLLSGGMPQLPKTYKFAHEEDKRIPYDNKRPLLINGNGGNDTDFLFRSLLSRFKPESQFYYIPENILETIQIGKFEAMGIPLYQLYNLAFLGKRDLDYNDSSTYGKYYFKPILKIKDSSIFQYSFRYSKNIFSYSLITPVAIASESRFKEIMENDLHNYFGYEAEITKKKCPYLKLVVTREAKLKLKSKGGVKVRKSPNSEYLVLKNYEFKEFVHTLSTLTNNILIDESGFNNNIDITLNCLLKNWNDVTRALHEQGIDLVKGEKEMKVVTITDNPRKSL